MESYRISRARPVLGPWQDSLVDVTIIGGVISDIQPSGGRSDGDLDCDGAQLWPGLWDHHAHFSTHALIQQAARLSPDATLTGTLAAVRNQLSSEVTHLIGFGFRSSTWVEIPTAADLDEVTGRPVALMSRDLHSLWCNTAGLELAGLPGHPTGFLVEDEAFAAIRHLMATQPELVDRAVAAAEQEAARRGVVGIVDMEMDWALAAWQRRARARRLGLHVVAATYPERFDELLGLGLSHGHEVAPDVRVGPLKIIADGSMGSRTAHCIDPYPTPLPHLPHGRVNLETTQLTELLVRAHDAGLHAAVHAIGDAACRDVLDAFEASGCAGSVEHAQCVPPQELPRFGALGLTASIQPAHQIDDAEVIATVWPNAHRYAYPMRSLLAHGARLALGSDAPVAPLDPWLAIHAACHQPYRGEEALDLATALQASAHSTIEVGQAADLVVASPPGEAVATMVGGRITHLR